MFELFLLLEAVCMVPRAHRQLLVRGWLTFAINGVEVDNVYSKDGLLIADSALGYQQPGQSDEKDNNNIDNDNRDSHNNNS